MNRPASTTVSVLRGLDVAGLRDDVRKETGARQHHVPPVSVYRWWARRTESVSGAIVDALEARNPGKRLLIADPFAGGGMIALAALIRGHRVYAQDVNPWAARGLATMLDLPGASELSVASDRLAEMTSNLLSKAYDTTMSNGTPGVVVHTIRVATGECPRCTHELSLFPMALVSLLTRVDTGGSTGYLACPAGHLNIGSMSKTMRCKTCRRSIDPTKRYLAGRRLSCAECGWSGRLIELCGAKGFGWKVVLVERAGDGVREIGTPSSQESKLANASSWRPRRQLPLISEGSETATLTSYGMRYWHDLYPARQRVVLEGLLASCESAAEGDPRLASALETAVIGSVEMAGYLSRWDARYLKSYEVVANHRFNFTTLSVEPNVWGAGDMGRGTVSRRLEQMAKASIWLDEHVGRRLVIDGTKDTSDRRVPMAGRVDARVVCGSSSRICLPVGYLDAVVTDPPYHDDVQYSELSDLFRAWSGDGTGVLDGDAVADPRSAAVSTERYRDVLTEVFTEVRRALRTGGHLVLSYANREPQAWVALFSALQDAGFIGLGYSVVLSENDADHSKVGKRACNLDVLIDLVAAPNGPIRRFRPPGDPTSDEEVFCRMLGEQALRVGMFTDGWENEFIRSVCESAFIA